MQNILELKAPVLQVKPLPKGEFVGYSATFRAPCDMRIAIVSVGYGDGLPRSLSSRGKVIFYADGKPCFCPILGRVSMDNIICDISALAPEAVSPGDFGWLINDDYTVDDIARDAGTIAYELISNLGKIRALSKLHSLNRSGAIKSSRITTACLLNCHRQSNFLCSTVCQLNCHPQSSSPVQHSSPAAPPRRPFSPKEAVTVHIAALCRGRSCPQLRLLLFFVLFQRFCHFKHLRGIVRPFDQNRIAVLQQVSGQKRRHAVRSVKVMPFRPLRQLRQHIPGLCAYTDHRVNPRRSQFLPDFNMRLSGKSPSSAIFPKTAIRRP